MAKLDRWIAGTGGAVLAALIALAAGVSGLAGLPALDRNESVFVQATVQMLESGDFTAIRYQDYWRGGTSPGAHWLQAELVELVSAPEARAIWAYRLASLISVAIAAAATVWGGTALFGPRTAFIAGVSLSVSLIVATAAGVATADAPLLAALAVMFAGFARTYAAVREQARPRRRDRALFWGGLIAGVIITGPEALALAGLCGLILFAADRRADWLKSLGWGWGLIALAAFAGPWAVAVTVATDGAFWSPVARPPLPWSPPLWQTALSPVMIFPMTALLPLGAVYAWRERKTPGVRVAVAWLISAWIVTELSPQKQIFGALPLYIPIAWLGAAGLTLAAVGTKSRAIAAILVSVTGLILGGIAIYAALRFGLGADIAAGIAAAGLFVATGLATALAVVRPNASRALVFAAALALLTPAVLLGAILPNFDRLWPTKRIMRALADNDLDPRKGLAIGPVAASGYEAPSLIFALGASTETGGGDIAARAIADGRPAVVESSELPEFSAALTRLRAAAQPIGLIQAYDYADAREITVTVFRPAQ